MGLLGSTTVMGEGAGRPALGRVPTRTVLLVVPPEKFEIPCVHSWHAKREKNTPVSLTLSRPFVPRSLLGVRLIASNPMPFVRKITKTNRMELGEVI